jgi:hypothetical protein
LDTSRSTSSSVRSQRSSSGIVWAATSVVLIAVATLSNHRFWCIL